MTFSLEFKVNHLYSLGGIEWACEHPHLIVYCLITITWEGYVVQELVKFEYSQCPHYSHISNSGVSVIQRLRQLLYSSEQVSAVRMVA